MIMITIITIIIIHIYIYILYTCRHIYIYLCIRIRIHIHIHIHTHVHVHIHVHMHTHIILLVRSVLHLILVHLFDRSKLWLNPRIYGLNMFEPSHLWRVSELFLLKSLQGTVSLCLTYKSACVWLQLAQFWFKPSPCSELVLAKFLTLRFTESPSKKSIKTYHTMGL